MGQIFSLVFVKDFPLRWPSFFTDLVGTLSFGRTAVEFYLIVLSTMDSEVRVLLRASNGEKHPNLKVHGRWFLQNN